MVLPQEPQRLVVHRRYDQLSRRISVVQRPLGPWALDLDFRRDELDPRLIVTAPGPKTYWDSDSILRVAPPGTWPIEWDPATRQRRGRSVWEARTNAVTYNRNLGARIGNLVDFVASSAGRWRMRETTVEGAHYLPQSFNATAGQWVSVSAITAKAGEGGTRHPVIVFTGSAMAANYGVQLNLDTGQLSYSSPAAATALRVSTLQLPDGTWIFAASAQASNTAVVSVQYRIGNTPAISFNAYAGDGISGVDWDWMQAEIGERPGPAIPTEGAAVTRPAEVVSVNPTGWLSQQAGTFVIDTDCVIANGRQSVALTVGDGSPSNRMYAGLNASRQARLVVQQGASANSANFPAQIPEGTSRLLMVVGYMAGGAVELSIGGQTQVVPGNLPIPPMSLVRLGSSESNNATTWTNAPYRRLRYSPQMLGRAEREALSLEA